MPSDPEYPAPDMPICDAGYPEPAGTTALRPGASPEEVAAAILATLRRWRFRIDNEAALQAQVADKLIAAGFPAEREVRLGPGDRIDVMVGAVGIEIKIKGQRRAIFRQCQRYCGYERVAALVVVTSAAMGFPPEIDGKPLFVHQLGRGWL